VNIDTILIGITLIIVLVGVGFTIHGYIRNKILKRKLKVFYKSHYGPEKKEVSKIIVQIVLVNF